MNYKQSKQILEEIEKVDKILVNCHKNPDPDSVGSALAMSDFVSGLGKEVRIVCPTKIDPHLNFLEGFDLIEQSVDFNKIDYKKYGLFVILDSSSWDFASKTEKGNIPAIKIINIDHHRTNEMFGEINLVDSKLVSISELIYLLFEDWGIDINKKTANSLLAGIIGDSGVYRFAGTTAGTLEIAAELVSKGADQKKIIFNIYNSVDFGELKFWGKVLEDVKYDKKHNFVWVAISNGVFRQYDGKKNYKEDTATTFFSSIEGSDFGIVMIEEEKGKLNVSLRSRTGLDVSKIAVELGGGGHRYAAGCGVHGLEFDDAVEKILDVARKYAKKNNKRN